MNNRLNGYDWYVLILIGATTAIVAALVWVIIEDTDNWEAFKIDHKCKAVAHIRGDIFNTVGIDSKGNTTVGIGSTSDKTGWLCDDGVTYYR